MTTMTDFFATLNRDHDAMLVAIQDLPDAVLDRKGMVGEWSIKNVLAHLTVWEKVVVEILPVRISTGQTPEILATINEDAGAWNAGQIAACESLTPREQLAQTKQARQALMQVLRDAGEEKLNQRGLWSTWDGTLAEYVLSVIIKHESEHCEAVLAALKELSR